MPTTPEPDPHVLIETAPGITEPPSLPEGWQLEGHGRSLRWHYIRGTEALCGRFGFYRGLLQEGGLVRSDNPDDCAACKRKVNRELDARPEAPK